MWWTHFGAGEEYDAFHAATNHLFVHTHDSPSQGDRGRPAFALDCEQRLRDLSSAGLRHAEADRWRWSVSYDTARLVGLYRTFSPIQVPDSEQRARLLDGLAKIAEKQFGGTVNRRLITQLYTAQKVDA
jgi:hypothetical protein